MRNDVIILIDAGHGGWLNGQYTTSTATGKQYCFTDHNRITAYEGMMNRQIADLVTKRLNELGIRWIKTYHEQYDTSRPNRIALEHAIINLGYKTLFQSLHHNAYGPALMGPSVESMTVGSEIWTSKGDTPSDPIAEFGIEGLKMYLPERNLRTDYFRDGDGDKEADYDVLAKTNGPAILWEFGYFNNWDDYMYCIDTDNQNRFADAVVYSITQWIKTL